VPVAENEVRTAVVLALSAEFHAEVAADVAEPGTDWKLTAPLARLPRHIA